MKTADKLRTRTARRRRIRARVSGTAARPRLAIFRSNTAIYAQLIDDTSGTTVAAASDIKEKTGSKSERAKKVGLAIAAAGVEKKISSVVFDRGGYRYAGRVKAVAEAAREAGLTF